MANRFYGYQYDTNPKKLNPENAPRNSRYPNEKKKTLSDMSIPEQRKKFLEEKQKADRIHKKEYEAKHSKNNKIKKHELKYEVQQKINQEVENEVKINNKKETKAKIKAVSFILAVFSVLFTISYQNSLISESFNIKEQYKKEYESLSKTNQQIEVGIENNLNLNNIEKAANDKLGMHKLNNNQKIYVSLPKQDYIAPATEQIIQNNNMNFFEKIINGFTGVIK